MEWQVAVKRDKWNNASFFRYWIYFYVWKFIIGHFCLFECRTGDCSGSSSSSSPSSASTQQQQQHNHQSQYHYHHQQSQQNREQQQYASSSSSGESNDRSGANCVFVPFLTDNRNITSSLMSHPHLLNVRSFCDSTTHNKHAPTKHNFLCDQKSVSEVIYSHPDFHNSSALSR